MATQQIQDTRTQVAVEAPDSIQPNMEAMMNEHTVSLPSNGSWVRRASAGLLALTIVSAVGVGIVRGSLDQVVTPASPKISAVAPDVTEAFREFKLEQAELRAGSVTESALRVPAISESYRQLKDEQMARWLEEVPMTTPNTAPARLSARERFVAMKDRQVMQRTEMLVAEEAAVAPVVTENYRALKERQVEHKINDQER